MYQMKMGKVSHSVEPENHYRTTELYCFTVWSMTSLLWCTLTTLLVIFNSSKVHYLLSRKQQTYTVGDKLVITVEHLTAKRARYVPQELLERRRPHNSC